MTSVVLDPKITSSFGRSYHKNLCGFLRFIGAKLIFETKFSHSEFWQSLGGPEAHFDLRDEYDWLKHDENSKQFHHHSVDPAMVSFEHIHDCMKFLQGVRPQLIATNRDTIEQGLVAKNSRPLHIQNYYSITDPTEDFTYKPKNQPSTQYYGGADFDSLIGIHSIARHWKALNAIPTPRSYSGMAHMKALLKNFCAINDVVYIFDRTICAPIAQATDGKKTYLYQFLQEVLNHPNSERVVIVTESLSHGEYGDSRQQTYSILEGLFRSSKAEVEFFAINKKSKYAKKIFDDSETKPWDLGVLIGTYLKYEWHHFSVSDELASPPKVYAYFLDESDKKSISVYKQFSRTDNPDLFCDWVYRSDY